MQRPMVLGFIGKDWRRKGLPFLLQVREELQRAGVPTVVRAAGHCPAQLARKEGIEFAGFIDKAREARRFLDFLKGCDFGCLFSEREPLGISTLEFLRAGVPVVGFTVEGVADTLPPDAGLRFAPGESPDSVANVIRMLWLHKDRMQEMREAARRWSPLVTWKRCIDEWAELLRTGAVTRPVRPWNGLAHA
jgi:glycosyltransferase involved in cell wall biosynthesis